MRPVYTQDQLESYNYTRKYTYNAPFWADTNPDPASMWSKYVEIGPLSGGSKGIRMRLEDPRKIFFRLGDKSEA